MRTLVFVTKFDVFQSQKADIHVLTYFVAEAAAAAANEVVTETAKEGIVLVVSGDK